MLPAEVSTPPKDSGVKKLEDSADKAFASGMRLGCVRDAPNKSSQARTEPSSGSKTQPTWRSRGHPYLPEPDSPWFAAFMANLEKTLPEGVSLTEVIAHVKSLPPDWDDE